MFKDNRYLHYDAAGFRKDLIAGITVGIVAIPLGMAFAIASGSNLSMVFTRQLSLASSLHY